jgi:hypothetical protein
MNSVALAATTARGQSPEKLNVDATGVVKQRKNCERGRKGVMPGMECLKHQYHCGQPE